MIIGKYKIIDELSRGGMGIVYRAFHPTLRRVVVLKKLTIRGNPSVLERFRREAQILLDLQNANIVHMFDYFTEGSFHYIVLEYVDGMSLDKLLKKQKKISVQMSLLIIRDACRALNFAHEHGIVHRDIKPGNILISRHGDIKLADFGIAFSDREQDDSITQSGTTLGTPAYMPPEQFNDSKNVDKRADIYAMGVMFYEMITGVKPFPGNFGPETIIQIQKGKYANPKKLDKNIPYKICHLIKKMMRAKPKQRFQDVSQIINIIEKNLNKYDISELKTALEQSTTIKNFKEQTYIPRNRSLHRFFTVACCCIALSCISFFLYKENIFFKTLLRPWYSSVSINMALPNSTTNENNIPMSIFFFENDGKDIPEIKRASRVFSNDSKIITQNWKSKISEVFKKTNKSVGLENNQYSIKPVYLKNGTYRIKVVIGSYIWWQSIYIDKSDIKLNLNFLENAIRSLKVHKAAFDKDGQDLTTSTTFSILKNNTWQPFSDDIVETSLTNGIIKIKAEADGYSSEIFSLKIDWYQDELFVNALLKQNE